MLVKSTSKPGHFTCTWRGRMRVASKLSAQRFLFSVLRNWKSTTSFLRANRLLVPPLGAEVLQKSNIKIVMVYESWIPSWQQDCCKVSGFTNGKRRARVLDGTDTRPSTPLGEVGSGSSSLLSETGPGEVLVGPRWRQLGAHQAALGRQGHPQLEQGGNQKGGHGGKNHVSIGPIGPHLPQAADSQEECHSQAPSFKACLGLARLCWRVWRKDHPVNPA